MVHQRDGTLCLIGYCVCVHCARVAHGRENVFKEPTFGGQLLNLRQSTSTYFVIRTQPSEHIAHRRL